MGNDRDGDKSEEGQRTSEERFHILPSKILVMTLGLAKFRSWKKISHFQLFNLQEITNTQAWGEGKNERVVQVCEDKYTHVISTVLQHAYCLARALCRLADWGKTKCLAFHHPS